MPTITVADLNLNLQTTGERRVKLDLASVRGALGQTDKEGQKIRNTIAEMGESLRKNENFWRGVRLIKER